MPVLIFHAGLGLSGGYVGVDVFFVISGYLITSLLLREIQTGTFSLLDFYERRARRILPALFFMLGATSVAASIILLPSDLADFGKGVIAAAAFFANIWLFLQQGYFTEAAELQPLLHTWSLGVEEQFYLFFPPLLWFLHRVLTQGRVALAIGLLAAISLILSIRATFNAPEAAFYLPQYRVWELFLGALLAIAITRDWLAPLAGRKGLLSLASLAGVAAICWAVLSFDAETAFPGLAAALPCLGAGLIIASGSLGQTLVSRALSTAPVVFVGKLSYSLYLWHWPVISLTYYTSDGEISAVQGVLCLLASFALAYISWAWVEQPFRNRARVSRKAILVSSVSSFAVMGAVGFSLAASNGLPGRLPPDFFTRFDKQNLLHDRRDCHGVTPDRAAQGDVCLRGDTSAKPSFALVGDSHADAISPAVFAAAKDMGLAGYQYTNAGFRPLVGVSEQGDPEFERETEAFLAFMSDLPQISTIFVTGFWVHQMTGYSYRHEGDIWKDSGYDGNGSAYNAEATLNGLRKLAKRLPNKRIVLLDDIPTGSALDVKTQIRRLRFGHADVLGLAPAEAAKQRDIYDAAFRSLAASTYNLRYYRMFDSLCGPALCPLFAGDTLLYRNGDHLSHMGALHLQDDAKRLLETFLSE